MPIDPSIPGQALAGLQRVPPFNPLATLGDLAQLQNYRALQQERQAQAEKLQRQEAEDADIHGLAQQYPDDHDAFIKSLYQRGYAGKAAVYEKLLNDGRRSAAEAHKSQIDAENAQLDAGLRTLSAVQDDPSYQIVRRGIVAADQTFDSILPPTFDPEKLRPIFNKALETKDWLKTESDAAQYVIKNDTQNGIALLFSRAGDQQKWERATQLAKQAGAGGLAAQYGPQWSPEAQQGAAAQLEKTAKAEKGPNVGSFEDYVTRTYGPNPTPAQILAARKAYGQADDRPARVSVTVPTVTPGTSLQDLAKTAGMSPGALATAAKIYHETGTIQGFGMQGKGPKLAIMNAESLLYPGESNIPLQSASYKANAASLKMLTSQKNAVESYSKTGLKNLDLFLKQAEGLTDTGSPWINQPIRTVQERLLGQTDMPAFRAARQVALTEIARVVQNPNLVGILTDSAREEILAIHPENATFAQIARVADILRQDMRNREQSINEQIAAIKGDMGGQVTPAATPPPTSGAPTTIGRFKVRVKP